MKGSRHIDQQTGRQIVTSAHMKREHTAIDSYGQTGVDRLFCLQHYMHKKHEDHWRDPDILINKQVCTDYTVYITTHINNKHEGIRIYTDQQTGVDRQYCVHYYMYNKHEGIQTYWVIN